MNSGHEVACWRSHPRNLERAERRTAAAGGKREISLVERGQEPDLSYSASSGHLRANSMGADGQNSPLFLTGSPAIKGAVAGGRGATAVGRRFDGMIRTRYPSHLTGR